MLLVRGAVGVTMDRAGSLVRDGAVLIEGDRIRAVGQASALDRPELTPLHRVYESLVYAAGPAAVDTVIVDGRVVVNQARMCTLDGPAVMAEARAAAGRLAGRAGLASLSI